MYANQQAKTNKGKMKNLWNRMGLERPLPAFTHYVRKINDFEEDEFDRFWTRHRVNEFNDYSIFSNTDKLKIMDSAIQGCFLISNLKHYGYLKAYFPLHNEYEMTGWKRDKHIKADPLEEDLQKAMGDDVYEYIEPDEKFVVEVWSSNIWKVFTPPVDMIRHYYGEKIAYYFDFIALESKFVSILIIFGLLNAITLWIKATDSTISQVFIIMYAIVNVVVATIFIEYLKREEKYRAATWGTTKLAEEDYIRPLFKGIFRRSPINDDLNDPHYTFFMKYWRIIFSIIILLICTGIAAGLSVGLFVARYKLAKEWEGQSKIIWSPIITSIAGGILLYFKDFLFKPVCKMLTRLENIKTEAAFEYSYVMKFFFFRFINIYGPLFYIAFAKKYVTGCISTENNFIREQNTCLWELRYDLIVNFILYMAMNAFEILVPFMSMGKILGMKIDEETIKGKTQEEILRKKVYIEYHKNSYEDGEINGVVEEYFEIIIQIGIVFLFSIAFGLIPVIVVFGNVLETLIDRKKLVSLTQRPVQQSAKSHGIFTFLVEIMAFVGIFTNFGVMCFTAEALGKDAKFTGFIWS